METLDEFNKRRREQREALNMPGPRPNGIACPMCMHELMDSDPSMMLTSSPPQKNVHCPACGYAGYRVA